MYIDIISYKLAQNITHAQLLEAAQDIHNLWMKKQSGFIKWEINQTTLDNTVYKDFVYWKDKASAELATQNMKDIPADHPWLACYDMTSVSSNPLAQLLELR